MIIKYYQITGNSLVLAAVALHFVLWFAIQPGDSTGPDYTIRLLGEALGASSLILMASIAVMACRPQILEPLFEGLDRMYLSHSNFAILLLLFLNLHSMTVSGPEEKENLARSLGGFALDILLWASIWALAPRIWQWLGALDRFLQGIFRTKYAQLKDLTVPYTLISLISKGWRQLCIRYDLWRAGHKVMAFVPLLGMSHIFLVDSLTKKSPALTGYMFFWAIAAAAASIYRVAFAGRKSGCMHYVLEARQEPAAGIMELVLSPLAGKMLITPGQFVFARFLGTPGLAWQHPFTVSRFLPQDHLRLSIKSAGDHTRRMHEVLHPGMKVELEGPYGVFNFKTGGQRQIWVAGGIGITPFLGFVSAMGSEFAWEIDLFYSVSRSGEFLHIEELQAAAQAHHSFRLHLHISSEQGRLTVARILETGINLNNQEIYLCGPGTMVAGLVKQFRAQGVPLNRIHYEIFQFR